MNAIEIVLNNIATNLTKKLNFCGLMFRLFHRIKSDESIKVKLNKKATSYRTRGKKMQDYIGLRITLYYSDDVEIVRKYLRNQPNFIEEIYDKAEEDKFCPKRLNIVMRVPNDLRDEMKNAIDSTGFSDLIDDTYEIQIRTILSEGWHEVEHDLRYKCKEEWDDFLEESRLLNGVYATLESAEWSMLTLFNRLSYLHYKNKNWTSMIRNKMRLSFKNTSISPTLAEYLDQHRDTAKQIFRVNRSKVLGLMIEKGFSFPLVYDTIVFLLNHIGGVDKNLSEKADPSLLKELNSLFGEFE